jgi:ABC-type transport system involved in cytochrome bd biosynthesis fused ATPase/permease subunit
LDAFIGQRKIAHSGKLELRAAEELGVKLSEATKEERVLITTRTKELAASEVNGKVIDPFELDVTSPELTALLGEVGAGFHSVVKTCFEARGIEFARLFVESTPGVKLPAEEKEEAPKGKRK